MLLAHQGIGQDPTLQLYSLPDSNLVITLSRGTLTLWSLDYNNRFWKHKVVGLKGIAFAFDVLRNEIVVIAYQNGQVQKFDIASQTLGVPTQILQPDHGLKLKDYKTNDFMHLYADTDGTSFVMTEQAEGKFQIRANLYTAFQKNYDQMQNPVLKNQKVIINDEQVLFQSAQDQINRQLIQISKNNTQKRTEVFYRTHGEVTDFCIHPSGAYILAVTKNGYLYIFNYITGDLRAKITVEPNLKTVSGDLSGLLVAVGTASGTVQIIETQNGRKVSEIDPMFTSAGHCCFTSDCRFIIVTDDKFSALKFFSLDDEHANRARQIRERTLLKNPIEIVSQADGLSREEIIAYNRREYEILLSQKNMKRQTFDQFQQTDRNLYDGQASLGYRQQPNYEALRSSGSDHRYHGLNQYQDQRYRDRQGIFYENQASYQSRIQTPYDWRRQTYTDQMSNLVTQPNVDLCQTNFQFAGTYKEEKNLLRETRMVQTEQGFFMTSDRVNMETVVKEKSEKKIELCDEEKQEKKKDKKVKKEKKKKDSDSCSDEDDIKAQKNDKNNPEKEENKQNLGNQSTKNQKIDNSDKFQLQERQMPNQISQNLHSTPKKDTEIIPETPNFQAGQIITQKLMSEHQSNETGDFVRQLQSEIKRLQDVANDLNMQIILKTTMQNQPLATTQPQSQHQEEQKIHQIEKQKSQSKNIQDFESISQVSGKQPEKIKVQKIAIDKNDSFDRLSGNQTSQYTQSREIDRNYQSNLSEIPDNFLSPISLQKNEPEDIDACLVDPATIQQPNTSSNTKNLKDQDSVSIDESVVAQIELQ